jgi:hypothetical protein
MQSYIVTSGVLFTLLVIVHIARIFVEGPAVILEPAFAASTILGVGMSTWALLLVRRVSIDDDSPED